LTNVNLGTAMNEGDLRLAYQDGLHGHVACRKLITSPSWTM
jgi:hypothetical protein